MVELYFPRSVLFVVGRDVHKSFIFAKSCFLESAKIVFSLEGIHFKGYN